MKNIKHNNQVRIIGGQCRGRKLNFSDAEGLRPTPDMVREKLFNWLGQDLTNKRVLDLFSGSGALGFEAASRCANTVVMVEKNQKTAAQLRKSIVDLQLHQVEIVCADGLDYLKRPTIGKFDMVFLDPPFSWSRWPLLFNLLNNCLNEDAMVYIEAGSFPELPGYLQAYRQGRSGKSFFELLIYSGK
ncbi:lactate dehydrogenase [Neisseria arctica]|uniref:Lactate dehydrogenase n=1 Tax=Neisseria arctica TaxID=1470200 RepID=A0A0J0YPC4_9NEIS|nr:16S rRNA (guanine(966)-N(2))-methyltransferase RsmD [Neisseria arctica]KLT71990.1 lactate dehydrogenase [Neisseria arctica]UOO86819.1 16S rRNA (guanine(966)-N(2))-methyltransferase RsmD [Neisseria arctica]